MTAPTTAPEVPEAVRDRLALVLDLDDVVAATRLARELRPWFGVAKVGLELYSAVGPDIIAPLRELGYDVFVDLKLHDIPTTVNRAARVLGALGASLRHHARLRRARHAPGRRPGPPRGGGRGRPAPSPPRSPSPS